MGSLGFCDNSLFNNIYSNVLVFKVAYALYLRVFFKKIGIKRLILALIGFEVIGVNSLIYIGLVGLEGFYGEVFR